MFLFNDMIGVNGDNMQALIGCYSDLGTDILGRFVNTQSGYLPNYGLISAFRTVFRTVTTRLSGRVTVF